MTDEQLKETQRILFYGKLIVSFPLVFGMVGVALGRSHLVGVLAMLIIAAFGLALLCIKDLGAENAAEDTQFRVVILVVSALGLGGITYGLLHPFGELALFVYFAILFLMWVKPVFSRFSL